MVAPLIRLAAGGAAAIVIATVSGSGIAAADPGGTSHSSHSRHGDSDGADRRHRDVDQRGTSNRSGGSRTSAVSTPDEATVSVPPSSVSTSRIAAPDVPLTGARGGPAITPNADRGPDVVPKVVPNVRVGNGRSPGVPAAGPKAPAQVGPASEIVPPPPVAPTLVLPADPASPARPPEPLRSAAPVSSYWGTLNAGWPAGVLFGIAGLLLAPIAGVWLGHRQARATKAASQLVNG